MDVVFSFDGTGLDGQTLVVFETLSWKGIEIASHEDINDIDQKVYIPKIGTTAEDSQTGSHTGTVSDQAVITDTVEYSGLTPGKSYEVAGTIRNRDTGEAILEDGKEVTASATFVPNKPDGSLVLTFTIDASALAGQTVVAFETVSYEGVPVAVHADITDEQQSVHYPDIRTEARNQDTGNHVGTESQKAVIEDTVSYSNLIPGQEYVLRGKLMVQETGKEFLVDGKAVTAERTFMPETASGEVTVNFVFDSRNVAGQTLVVYEELFYNGIAVTKHADLDDEMQSIHYPAITTEATDRDTKEHIGFIGPDTEILDTVSYTNLIPGQEYVLRGKSDGAGDRRRVLV
ncbi:MAG: VaFE repeat-containing surface-anchored protein [Eisenbergiella sp.]